MNPVSEEPTNDLRQLRRPIKQDNGVCGPGYREWTIGYETVVQRKWIVTYGDTGVRTWTKDMWRDLPIVYEGIGTEYS